MFFISTDQFNLKNTFNNGQCFRFNEVDGGFLGVAQHRVLFLRQADTGVYVSGIGKEEFNKTFTEYFDLNRDYNAVTGGFCIEENLCKAIEYGRGMRILRQDAWETVISFIISQNNNISRIKGIIERICAKCGDELTFEGCKYFAFPSPQQLAALSEYDFSQLGCGYRASYLALAAREVCDNGLPDFSGGYDSARAALMRFKGIGPKVADCIALFGLGYYEAFPVDTWVKKVMCGLYLKKRASGAEICAFAHRAFGEYAGIAQQYLFYYARENKIRGLED